MSMKGSLGGGTLSIRGPEPGGPAQSIVLPGGRGSGHTLHTRLLLLVLLTLEMLLVCLRPGTRDLAHLAVVQLLRLGRDPRSFELLI